ncbi:MAG: trehalose-6-phosphate synthase, partial [Casimicrobiaceae bacterium]
LVPVLTQHGGTWIGWPGADGPDPSEIDGLLAQMSGECGYRLQAVHLSQAEIHDFYQGFSNEIVWPLFHDLLSVCNFDPAYWRTYQSVNRKYAAAVAAQAQQDDFVWVHDYHLMNVGAELRALGNRARLGFFLHVPFPSLDLFSKLPWCSQLIEALLQYDLIGLQTTRDRRNFVQCVRALVPEAVVEGKGRAMIATHQGRRIRIGAFPISIDFDSWIEPTHAQRVQDSTADMRRRLPECKLVLGIDRLDYTKGIPLRLQAFHDLLKRRPEFRERISLIQVVVPSRVDIPEYDALKTTIEQLVGRINGEFMKPGGWVPVWYMYGHLPPDELVAYYRSADVALVTPLRDGMNLVAKEYCASNLDEGGVLVLSEFAGAAAQLGHGALLVNPYAIEGVADALAAACTMPLAERRARMALMRNSIRHHDVHWWTDTFLDAATAAEATVHKRPLPIEPAARSLRPANDDMRPLPSLAVADPAASSAPRLARVN